ncbi:MAG: hypothetical protein R6U11_07155 [Bacteroidales bacterium]
MKQILLYFLSVALLTFVVSAIVTYLYSLLVHASGTVDWGTAFRLGTILGIVLTWNYARDKKKNK